MDADDLVTMGWCVGGIEFVFILVMIKFIFDEKKSTMKKMKLIVDAGEYESDSLFSLIIEVLKHRTWHLFNHGKWMD